MCLLGCWYLLSFLHRETSHSPDRTHPTPTPNRAINEARGLVGAPWDSLQQRQPRQTQSCLLISATAHGPPHHFHPCRCCLQSPMTATSAQLPCCPPWVCIVLPMPTGLGSLCFRSPDHPALATSPDPGWEQLPTSEPTSHSPKMCVHPLSSSEEIHSNPNWTIFLLQLYVVAMTPAPMSRLISHILHQRLVP